LCIFVATGLARAQTPTVNVWMTTNPAAGTWQLLATDSNDNGGISAFALDLQGCATGTINAPCAEDFSTMVLRGFTQHGVTVVTSGIYEYFGGQNTTDPNSLIWGVGQVAGRIPGAPPSIPDTTWGCPVLLASGTYAAGRVPTILNTSDNKASVNDFTANGGATCLSAQVVIVPEPATLAFLALAALALRRRQRV
jgi:hypothetical protein